MPHTGTQCGQPSSVLGPTAFRFAASACVVMPVVAQTTAATATIRPIVILSPMVGPVSGGLTNKTGGIKRRSKKDRYSINSSARTSSVGGISRPSVLAVFRFKISSNSVGCWTGRSPGLVPLKILSMTSATLRR